MGRPRASTRAVLQPMGRPRASTRALLQPRRRRRLAARVSLRPTGRRQAVARWLPGWPPGGLRLPPRATHQPRGSLRRRARVAAARPMRRPRSFVARG
eukprot:684406-Prorocentrum_minimum.AAC.1